MEPDNKKLTPHPFAVDVKWSDGKALSADDVVFTFMFKATSGRPGVRPTSVRDSLCLTQ